MAATETHKLDQERADLLESLAKHREFLKYTLKGLSEEQALLTPTASELCLAGIVKHVAEVEESWTDFIVNGPPEFNEALMQGHVDSFRLLDGESLESVLERYEEAARHTDDLLASLPSLDASQPLMEAPWNTPGARWTARRVFAHIATETAHHAGHADIIRETIDGQKTMG